MSQEEHIILNVTTNGVEGVENLKTGIINAENAANSFAENATSDFKNGMNDMSKSAETLTEKVKVNDTAMKNMRNEIKNLKSQLLSLDEGSKEYNDTLALVANKTLRLKDLNDEVKYSAMDLGAKLENIVKVSSGIASGFSVAQVAIGLFGGESEELEKIMLKTQQAIALVQGLEGLEGLSKTIPALIANFKSLKGEGLSEDLNKLSDSSTDATKNMDRLVAAQYAETASQIGLGNSLNETTKALSKQEIVLRTSENTFKNIIKDSELYYNTQGELTSITQELINERIKLADAEEAVSKASENLNNLTSEEIDKLKDKLDLAELEYNQAKKLAESNKEQAKQSKDNIQSLEDGNKVIKKSTTSLGGMITSIKGLGLALGKMLIWTALISAAITALTWLWDKLSESFSKNNEIVDDGILIQKRLSESISSNNKDAQKEISTLEVLYRAATNNNRSNTERLEAVKKLKKEFPEYFKNLKDEDIMLGRASNKYKDLKKYILEVAKAKAYSQTITENYIKIQEKEAERIGARAKQVMLIEEIKANSGKRRIISLSKEYQEWIKVEEDAVKSIDDINKKNDELADKITIVRELELTTTLESKPDAKEDAKNKAIKDKVNELNSWYLSVGLSSWDLEREHLKSKYNEELLLLEDNLEAKRLLTLKYNADLIGINNKEQEESNELIKQTNEENQRLREEDKTKRLEFELINLDLIYAEKLNKVNENENNYNESYNEWVDGWRKSREEREAEFEIQRLELIKQSLQNEIDIRKSFGEDVSMLEQQKDDADLAIKKVQISNKKKLDIDSTRSLLDNLEGIASEGTIAAKGIASSQTAIDTYKGSMSAYSSLAGIPIIGPALGAAAATAVGIKGAKAIKDIWKVKKDTKNVDTSNPSAPNISQIIPENIKPTKNILTNNEIDLQAKNNRVYVVMDDINTVGKKVDVIRNESTF